jgi:hypothetical protein
VINTNKEEESTMENKDKEKETLLKSISALLDETIEEVEKLSKGDVNFSDLKLQPKEQGDMADVAGQGGADALDPMKKEEKEAAPVTDEKQEEPKSEEAAAAAPAEEKKEEEKEEDKDEEEDEKEEDEDPEMVKFEALLGKCLAKLGYLSQAPKTEEVKKSEEAPAAEVKVEEKKEEPKEDLVKAQSEKIESLEKTVADLTKTVEELAKRPVGRKSVSGTGPGRLAKSEEGSEEQPAVNRGAVLDKLLDAQRAGDKRVNPVLVAKFEQSGDMNLVKDIVK